MASNEQQGGPTMERITALALAEYDRRTDQITLTRTLHGVPYRDHVRLLARTGWTALREELLGWAPYTHLIRTPDSGPADEQYVYLARLEQGGEA